MKAPIDRELQIKIMQQSKERSDALTAAWKDDAGVRDMLRRPSPKQSSATVITDVRLRKCA